MFIDETSKASIRYGTTPTEIDAIATGYLKALIKAGYLPPEMSYLACDPSKIERSRKRVMLQAREALNEIAIK